MVNQPDKYCYTRNDGECISDDPRCIHNQPSVVFSDEDLERLKAWSTSNGLNSLSIEKAQALLSRLEAAEWAMSELERHDRKGYLHDDLVEPLKAWRQVSGRE